MKTIKTKSTKMKKTTGKYESCSAQVTPFKFSKGVRFRSVTYKGKRMLFWSDIANELSSLGVLTYLESCKIKINVKKEQPGVRFLVSVDDFNKAYSKCVAETTKELLEPLKKTPEPIEQFNFSFVDMEDVPATAQETIKIDSVTSKIDLTVIKPFAKDPITTVEANSDKFSIVDNSPARPTPVILKNTNYEAQEAMRKGIIASVANYIAKRCPDMRDDSNEYKNVKQKTWAALFESFDALIAPYMQDKYGKSIHEAGLGFANKSVRPENYILRLMDIDNMYGDQLLKMLQDTSDACFDIRRAGK